MNAFLLIFALFGHGFLWIGIINRLHSVGIGRRTIKRITVAFFVFAGVIPVWAGWRCYLGFERPASASWVWDATTAAFVAYVGLCCLVAAATLVRLVYFNCFRRTSSIVRSHSRRQVEIDHSAAAESPEDADHHFLALLPYNEILQLEVAEWEVEAPRLPPALDGLSIVHISDTHFTGRVGKAYFMEVARVINKLNPDLIFLTGDIIDERECLDWIPDTFGRLTGRGNAYFILGNHDVRVDVERLRAAMVESGFIDLGGRWIQGEVRGQPLILAGNEQPWLSDAPNMENCPRTTGQFRVALAHTPDQLGWARSEDFDLLLAGHTHGGQIRIPALGAIFSPTLYGVKHVGGVFYSQPTILHVTHGVSGDIPVRWNCSPEVARITLRAQCAQFGAGIGLSDSCHP